MRLMEKSFPELAVMHIDMIPVPPVTTVIVENKLVFGSYDLSIKDEENHEWIGKYDCHSWWHTHRIRKAQTNS